MSNKKIDNEVRHFTHGAGGAMADAAADAQPQHEDHLPDLPYSRAAQPLKPGETPDQLAEKAAVSEDREQARVDESVEESFPASDPPSAHHIT